ncbi:hypothetical protein JHT90_07910 [Entomomonas asaccharolytica]|uniref:Alginate biosynthesis protein AlgX n=1 Tax=Entomomonas asaccharolytica TaxID=2785331 RepID=A0A974ND04_9GAMM|nr:hypothetical protein JHT90_07910 [Entomomonas asaccharolytica]
MNFSSINKSISIIIFGLLCLVSTQALAEKNCKDDLSCLICPALHDPVQYQTGAMKLMKELIPGKDRWLFRTMVDLSTDFGIPTERHADFARLMQTFKSKGIHVAMAIQPTRGLMHRDKLYDNDKNKFNYKLATAKLKLLANQMRRAGAVVPDVLPLIESPPKEDYFFRRDHHWTPQGAQITAKLVADEIKKQPFYKDLHKTNYKTSPGVFIPKMGTLNEGLQRVCGNNFGMQYVQGYQTIPENNDADALFGDMPEPEIVLVGTSNSAARENESKQFNFDGFLKQYLSADILNYALPGAGAEGSLLEYLLSENYDAKNPPKLIIWELVANYRLGDELTYRQLIPAVKGGCKKPLLSKTTKMSKLIEGQRIELLSNTADNIQQLNTAGNFLDIKFTDKNLKSFYIFTYYDNGARDKVWFRRPLIVTGGQFHLELSRSDEFKDANLLSVFIQPTQAVNAPISMEVSVCH